MKRIMIAILMVLLIAPALVVIGALQDFAEANLAPTGISAFIFSSWGIVLVILFVVGLFMAIRNRDKGGE
jgi:hypothetical protein